MGSPSLHSCPLQPLQSVEGGPEFLFFAPTGKPIKINGGARYTAQQVQSPHLKRRWECASGVRPMSDLTSYLRQSLVMDVANLKMTIPTRSHIPPPRKSPLPRGHTDQELCLIHSSPNIWPDMQRGIPFPPNDVIAREGEAVSQSELPHPSVSRLQR